jgi:hypothetical protein
MDAAASFIQIDTVAIRFVGEHQCPRNIRMRFCFVVGGSVFCFKSDGITLATDGAAVAGYLSYCEMFCHGVIVFRFLPIRS